MAALDAVSTKHSTDSKRKLIKKRRNSTDVPGEGTASAKAGEGDKAEGKEEMEEKTENGEEADVEKTAAPNGETNSCTTVPSGILSPTVPRPVLNVSTTC